ncbi:MAG: DNA polymerase domain-containing protein [Nitrososphaeria archaeon]
MNSGGLLIDGKLKKDKVWLYYLLENGKLIEWVDDEKFYPYIYISGKEEKEVSDYAISLGCKIVPELRKDLFSDKEEEYYKIFGSEETLENLKHKIKRVWEEELSSIEKYVFEKNIRFGIHYDVLGREYTPLAVEDHFFNEIFNTLLDSDPIKYNYVKKFFEVIEQPLPKITEDFARKFGYDKASMLKALYLSRITNTPLALKRMPPSYFIKSLYYLCLKSEGYIIPTAEEFARGEVSRGVYGKAALVIAPEKGVFLNTYVLDYESLYPSCIDVYNLSHETVNCGHIECAKNLVPEEKHHVCILRRGKYSVLIGALKDLRIKYYKKKAKEGNEKAKIVSDILKTILVICYGVTIRIRGLANPSLAESITAYARNALKTAWKIALESGLRPVYGDTDSLFIVNPESKHVQTLVNRVKTELGLDLAVDKKYKVCIFSTAKKAYLGIFDDGKIDPKGLTAYKSSTPAFVKKVLKETAIELTKIDNLEDIPRVRERINRILEEKKKEILQRKFDIEDMGFSVILHKNPNEILNSNIKAQSYQCAIQLIDAGYRLKKGQKITFVKVKPFYYKGNRFTVKPINVVKKDEINVYDYISNMHTMMAQILEPIGLRKHDNRNEHVMISDWFE